MEMEGEEVHCPRWSFGSKSDHVIKTLGLDGMPGSGRSLEDVRVWW